MKIQVVAVFCFLFSMSIQAQMKSKYTSEERDKMAIEHFQKNYKKKNYKKFENKINVYGKQVQFDDKLIYIENGDIYAKPILESGLFYPQLLTDYQYQKFLKENTDKSQKTFLKLQKDPKASFDVNKITVRFYEVNGGNDATQTKRFKILSKSAALPNIRYYVELTNPKANKDTKLEDFVKDAKLTYLQQD